MNSAEHLPAAGTDPYWFKRAVFYEVLVRSFRDTDGDGVGELRGLTEKLDYLHWLASTACGCRRFYRRRCATAATTSRTTRVSWPSSAPWRTSADSSASP